MRASTALFALLCVLAALHMVGAQAPPPPPSAIIPFKYPLYLQCDPKWGNDTMVSTTICSVGCLMSSVSMALYGHNIPIPTNGSHVDANPGTLNTWLQQHSGYDSSNDLIESVVPEIAPRALRWVGMYIPQTTLTTSALKTWVEIDTRVVIANVRNGTHFVLVTGFDSTDKNRFYVNDPYFAVNSYEYADIVGWRIFDMFSC
eukprot:TRINITY_DN4062_c0_g1_i1.p1 TRINITY_DN4062_c0_g1~~TRINITY_DN4062_c0_g1_i1.p1  ORF type:complete len:202 (+),score=68.54 TRINITY_DN4062_c0_g1_i1:87-692(+)